MWWKWFQIWPHCCDAELKAQRTYAVSTISEFFLPLVGHFVWRSWDSSSDILGFRQSFYTENGRQIWLLCWTFCLTIQKLLVRHFQNSSCLTWPTDFSKHTIWLGEPNASLILKVTKSCTNYFHLDVDKTWLLTFVKTHLLSLFSAVN